MKIALIALASLVLAVIVAMAFPDATIWQVALAPAGVLFASLAFNFCRA